MKVKACAICLSLLSPLVLGSCSLLNGGAGMINRMFSAGGRAMRLGDNDMRKPLRLEPGEIERARAAQGLPPLTPQPEPAKAGHVAAR